MQEKNYLCIFFKKKNERIVNIDATIKQRRSIALIEFHYKQWIMNSNALKIKIIDRKSYFATIM